MLVPPQFIFAYSCDVNIGQVVLAEKRNQVFANHPLIVSTGSWLDALLNFQFQLFVASLSHDAEGFGLQWQSHFFCESGTVVECAGDTPCVFQVLVFGGVVMPLLIKEFEPDLPHGALGPLVQDDATISHVMQAVTVAAPPPHKFEVEDVTLGCSGLVGLVVGNLLLYGKEFLTGFHAGTLLKAQRNFGPATRATGRILPSALICFPMAVLKMIITCLVMTFALQNLLGKFTCSMT